MRIIKYESYIIDELVSLTGKFKNSIYDIAALRKI